MRRLLLVGALCWAPLAVGQSLVPAAHLDAARLHATAHAAAARGTTPDLTVTDAHADARSGASYVYLRQQVAGLEVVGTEMTVAVEAAGRVAHAAGTDRALSIEAARVAAPAPALDAADAVSALAQRNGLGAGFFHAVTTAGTADRATTLSEGGVALDPPTARLVWLPVADALRLTWEVTLYPADARHYWLGWVDAATGEVLDQADLVVEDHFGEASPASFAPVAASAAAGLAGSLVGSYTVFAMPLESPYDGGRTSVANPDNATASPYGWHDTNGAAGAEYTITRGNNAYAYTDVDANNSPDTGSSPDGGAALSFNFPVDLAQAPSAYRPASVTNLFYWSNVIHDVMYQYGFTEAAGNFQTNTYGRGGSGNDAVLAESQDGSGTNNANFSTPADGSAPRMQMYIGTSPAPDVDGSFDNGVVVHEYGHGISTRLTGGRTNVSCLRNAEQQGEGWSDWYGLMFTQVASDTGPTKRGIGNYLFGYGVNGNGIRLAPYSTSFSLNNYTYGRTRTMTAVHQIGFVWATILWEATWEVMNVHGFSPDLYDANGTAGNQVMMRLVTEGLKLQPCSPGFVASRDAILAADQSLYGGAHTALLQAAFARRGLGYSASQGSSGSNTDNTEAFDLWPTTGNQAPTAAFSASCTGLSCTFTDASTDPDGTIASRAWTFGDGGTSTATSPSRTYAASGTYTVTLSVTDNNGATDATSQQVTVSGGSGPEPLVLSVSPRTNRNRTFADLSWTGFDGGQVVVYRNGASVGTTTDDGAVSYNLGRNVSGSDTWRVCDAEDGACSNDATVSYLDGFAGATETALEGAFPNPFASTADVRFTLAEAAAVEVVVFNSLGQAVATLASGTFEAGAHAIALDAADLPAGVYVVRLRAGDAVHTARVLHVR